MSGHGNEPVAIITGATSGVGLATARALLERGFSLGLVGRSEERLRATLQGLTTSPGVQVRAFQADLTSRSDLARLATELRAAYPRVQVLVNNAGAVFFRRRVSADGVEHTYALNVLAPFFLTQALLPALRAAAPSRVVNVASAAYATGRLELDDLERARHYGGWGAYSQSKLGLILLTAEFARREPDRSVTFNACHPGFVRSRFGQGNGWLASGAIRFLSTIAGISPSRGARVVVFLATSPDVASLTGGYYVVDRARSLPPKATDPTSAAALWLAAEARTAAISDRSAAHLVSGARIT
ncbi:MAG TPA: SDR family NAD(P)-dependent oxidoreductase [Thermoplasmata archaeon]|nr:SDR family NAD(P)-dependent oxidoreductase [Thermoplasmata archaeon]